MTSASLNNVEINLSDIFDQADETSKEYIYHVLTDHISIEDVMGDIVATYFCKQEKISKF